MVTNAAESREGGVQVAITALGPVALIFASLMAVLGAGWMLAPLLAGWKLGLIGLLPSPPPASKEERQDHDQHGSAVIAH